MLACWRSLIRRSAFRAPVKTGKVLEVQVLDSKGLANHTGPESCAGAGNRPGEALTGERVGRVLSREIAQLRSADGVEMPEGHTAPDDMARLGQALRGLRPRTCTHAPCAGTGRARVRPLEQQAGRIGKSKDVSR